MVIDELPLRTVDAMRLVSKEDKELIDFGKPAGAASWATYNKSFAEEANRILARCYMAGGSPHLRIRMSAAEMVHNLFESYQGGGPKSAKCIVELGPFGHLPAPLVKNHAFGIVKQIVLCARHSKVQAILHARLKDLARLPKAPPSLVYDVTAREPLGNVADYERRADVAEAGHGPRQPQVNRARLHVTNDFTSVPGNREDWRKIFRSNVMGPHLELLEVRAPAYFFEFDDFGPSNIHCLKLFRAEVRQETLPRLQLGCRYFGAVRVLELHNYDLMLEGSFAWASGLKELTFNGCKIHKKRGATQVKLPPNLTHLTMLDTFVWFDLKFFSKPAALTHLNINPSTTFNDCHKDDSLVPMAANLIDLRAGLFHRHQLAAAQRLLAANVGVLTALQIGTIDYRWRPRDAAIRQAFNQKVYEILSSCPSSLRQLDITLQLHESVDTIARFTGDGSWVPSTTPPSPGWLRFNKAAVQVSPQDA